MPKIEWQEWGNWTEQSGHIAKVEIPWVWWLMDHWLAHHPHWRWWRWLWGKLLPNWGDPFCAAYCTVWNRLYWPHEKVVHRIEGYEHLSRETRDYLQREHAELWEDDDAEDRQSPAPRRSTSQSAEGNAGERQALP